ncbi:hypothetical protein BP5796_10995 [Coleophoma crateriformis]|uniref:LsmAD domain-containing protein n=1 Tax=Coleophoma crateriformis TaxID=565419 RepID=A0A3D8QLJ4_9HELO|nr:hypothetical protein BP5796_10995 [Coleophoma crateriformis]
MVQAKKNNETSSINGVLKNRDQQSNMAFQRAANKNGQNGTANSFRTDTAISGNRNNVGRELKRWVPDAPEDVDNSLEAGLTGSSGGWDQFAENERRFGVKTDYDENIYTTAIDKSHPQYKQRLAEADRKAKEIERSAATNSHVAEERITDNLKAGSNGLDEEDKYSGVLRQNKQDFPPLASSSNRYMPPARRAPAAQSTVSGAPVDPAILSAQLARPDKPAAEKIKPASKPAKAEVPPTIAQPTPTATATAATTKPAPEAKATPAKATPPIPTGSSSRAASPAVKADGVPNATATVERDVASAFKGFAAQQRRNVDQIRQTKAKNDKEIKLNDLKKFADTFKLNTPVPADLVGIIAKDPAKQKEIQEKAKRNAEEAKTNPSEAVKPITPQTENRTAPRPAPATAGSSQPTVSTRQNAGRGGFSNQGQQYNSNSFRGDRQSQGQNATQQGHSGTLASRLRNGAQGKHSHPAATPIPVRIEHPHVPTGPSMSADPNFSRRSSGVTSAQGARLNPTSNEFRPNAFAPAFNPNPNANPSGASSPLSSANTVVVEPQAAVSRSLVKRKPVADEKPPSFTGKFIALDYIKSLKPPPGGNWEKNGGMKPAFATPPTWKQPGENEDPKSAIMETYKSIFEKAPFPAQQPMSPLNSSHAVPQAPHQHQLPFHLQQQNMHQRGSPRQPPNHLHNNHGPNPSFNGPDDHHRMMPSHSAQSFASPRLQNVPMAAYPSPMSQPAQMFNGQMMQYPSPQMARQFSQGQFMPQPTHMGPMMLQNPANGFMGPQPMGPGHQMMYPPGAQPHFMPPGNGPPGMPVNGYPSPGRSAPMMMSQGSQQGHQPPMYGMSPSQQYNNMAPIYAQQQPGAQMPMRGYGPQQLGTSPQQMHQYGGGHRNHQNGNYNNKNFQPNGQHANASPNAPAPAGPQPRPTEPAEEAK